jgi:hypothetical protein
VTTLGMLDGVPGLRLADRDWRALASMRHPVKVALWLALMRPTEELFSRESLVETKDGEATSIPAILAWAETVARKAIRGDMQASAMIADRIEGRTGTRLDEEDPEHARRRGDIQLVIEQVVTSMVNTRIAGGEALDITPTVSPYPVDSERQDSDTRPTAVEEREREEADNQARGQSLAETNDSPEERDLTDPLQAPPYTNGHTRNGSNGSG